ncbi:lysoplasmalogenase [Aliiruegeria sabulilitoris]|uniref:lysoplasmalogenase n=1 Tax=Aliiruegeria sabulilitoris TaxID=1510458 RepID=UPI00083563A1|nr:lysoplasmalogenase [Aliiruegeria sabulilitoris]NDR56899.1 lysoplasmalogenase [Pseudoruegeria sp. M32A2M]
MSLFSVPLALLATLSSATYLMSFCASPPSLVKSALKTASTLLLALSAVTAGATPWLIAALCLGALGDLLLSRDGQRAFLLGLIAFAIAHLAYVGLFVFEAGAEFAELAKGENLVAAFLLLAFGGVMAGFLWRPAGEMRWPVMAYVVVILAMGLSAVALPESAGIWPLLAALLFIASDAILASELFLLPQRHPARRFAPYAVWSLYWCAQALFLVAFLPLPPV